LLVVAPTILRNAHQIPFRFAAVPRDDRAVGYSVLRPFPARRLSASQRWRHQASKQSMASVDCDRPRPLGYWASRCSLAPFSVESMWTRFTPVRTLAIPTNNATARRRRAPTTSPVSRRFAGRS
jgi:hypothetical protein